MPTASKRTARAESSNRDPVAERTARLRILKGSSTEKEFNRTVKIVCDEFGIDRTLLLNFNRSANWRSDDDLVWARWMAMWIHKYRARCYNRDTAVFFGRSDADMNYALGKIKARMKKEPSFDKRIRRLADKKVA